MLDLYDLVAKLGFVGLGRLESELVCHLRLLTEVGSGRAYLSLSARRIKSSAILGYRGS